MADPLKIAIAVLGLLVVVAGGAALALGRIGPLSDPAEETSPEVSTGPGVAFQPAIPPIDAATPAQTETATFALG